MWGNNNLGLLLSQNVGSRRRKEVERRTMRGEVGSYRVGSAVGGEGECGDCERRCGAVVRGG